MAKSLGVINLWDQIWGFAIDYYIFHLVIIIGLAFLIFGPKKYKKVIFGKQGFELHSIDGSCGDIQIRHEVQLNKIEKLLEEDAHNRKIHQDELDQTLNGIKSNISKLFSLVSVNEQLTNKISEGTLTNQLFSDEIWPFLRLKAFRRLLAMKKNGRIWEKGFGLILKYKSEWLNVLDTELGIQIVDEEYYCARLDEIRKRIFDNFSYK